MVEKFWWPFTVYFCSQVLANDIVEAVKAKVEEKSGIPVAFQKFVYKGKTLSNDKKLSEYGICENCKIHVITKAQPAPVTVEAPVYAVDDFWKTLESILLKQYATPDVQKIMKQYQKDYEQLLTTMSLDDLERIAARKLQV